MTKPELDYIKALILLWAFIMPCTALLLWIIGYRARWFIIEFFVGLKWMRDYGSKPTKEPGRTEESNGNIDAVFQVNKEDGGEMSDLPKKMNIPIKFMCLIYTLIIFQCAGGIIIEKCILSVKRVADGDKCPFSGDCYDSLGTYFACTNDEKAKFQNYSGTHCACYSWVTDSQDAETILNAFGIMAGLLSLASGILPIMYYTFTCCTWHFYNNGTSSKEKGKACSNLWIVFMCLLVVFPLAAGIAIFILFTSRLLTPINVYVVVMVFLILFIAYLWVVLSTNESKGWMVGCCKNLARPYCCKVLDKCEFPCYYCVHGCPKLDAKVAPA